VSPAGELPSLVGLIASGILDAELAALVWLLVEGRIPLVVGAPAERIGAGTQLAAGVLASVRPEVPLDELERPLGTTAARKLIRGTRAAGVVAAGSLEEVFRAVGGGPLSLTEDELTFLGCVLVLGPADDATAQSEGGRLRTRAAHYVRPLSRDAQGHAQRLGPAVLAVWDDGLARYEHFAWGVLPEIASRLGRRAGDLERDLHHRRDDLASLAAASVTSLAEVRRLIAGYQAGYAEAHETPSH